MFVSLFLFSPSFEKVRFIIVKVLLEERGGVPRLILRAPFPDW
jgi:hypothetical protein